MEYLILKWLHILSATLLFGTGLGSAFYKFMTDRTGNLQAIAQTNKIVVLADWLFTTPTVILQPITGVWLAIVLGYPWSSSWLLIAIVLYIIAGLCWLPVVYLQIRMRDMALDAIAHQKTLGEQYRRFQRIWFWLGVPAFISLVVVYYLMVFKPTLWS
jgi:uncharacterized membrane protein